MAKIDFYKENAAEFDRLKSYNKEHEQKFNELIKREKREVFNSLKDVLPNCKINLKVGQICTYTNKYGVYFTGHKILGFCKPEKNNGCSVYLDLDCYWSPVPISSIS